jgi:predicted transcriptional regulator with HTH domain
MASRSEWMHVMVKTAGGEVRNNNERARHSPPSGRNQAGAGLGVRYARRMLWVGLGLELEREVKLGLGLGLKLGEADIPSEGSDMVDVVDDKGEKDEPS